MSKLIELGGCLAPGKHHCLQDSSNLLQKIPDHLFFCSKWSGGLENNSSNLLCTYSWDSHEQILDPVLEKRVRKEKYVLQPDLFSHRTSFYLFYDSLDKDPVKDAGIFPVKLEQINE